MANLLWSGFIFMMLLSGCGWNGTPTRKNVFTPLTSIEISAVSSTIAANTSTKLTANGNYSGLFTDDITDQVVWSSDTPAVAGFTTAIPSRVFGSAPGTATLTATVGNVSSTFKLTVSSASVTGLTITPAAPSVAVGLNTQFAANGTLSDSTTQDLTFDVTWASSAPGMGSVSNAAASKGLAAAVSVGTATITATFSPTISATTLMTVTAPVLQTIALSPVNPTLLTLSSQGFTATGTYSNNTTADITSRVAWSSSNPTCATIVSNSGTATALTQGTTTIGATLGGVSATTSLKATGGNLTAISISPAAITLVKDTVGRITATGTFSNGSSRDITGATTWTPANTSFATVTTSGGNLAFLNPLAVTSSTTIAAAAPSPSPSGTLSAATPLTLTVTSPALSSIAISPTTWELLAKTSSPFTVTATFVGGTTQDVTTLSTLQSSNTSVATIGTGGLAVGRVTGVATGTTTISATYGGKTAPVPAAVTVRTPALQSLTITGSTSVVAGNQVSLSVTANYGDGTTRDVTADASWNIDSSNIAILADSLNQPGQVVGVDSGSATLTVSFGGKTQTAKITVS